MDITEVASLSADFDTAKAIVSGAGYTRALDTFAYPFNARNLATDTILRPKPVRWSRTTGGNRFPVTSLGKPEMLAVGGLDIGQKTAAQFQAWVDDAILCGYSLVTYGHTIATTASSGTITATAEFNTMMAYAGTQRDAGLIDVITPSQFIQYAQ